VECVVLDYFIIWYLVTNNDEDYASYCSFVKSTEQFGVDSLCIGYANNGIVYWQCYFGFTDLL